MDTERLLGIVAEWVRGPELPALTPREQAVPDLRRPGAVVAVVGPRRAGKTWFLFQMIADLLRSGRTGREDLLFIDFEDYRLRDFQPEDMERLLAACYQLNGKPPRALFFDEIQRLPHWSRILRTLHNSRRYGIVVTGSNAGLLGSEVATELRGRYEDRLVLPFSFREFLRHRGIFWSRAMLATPEQGLVARAFDEFLRFGGFPEVLASPEEGAKRQRLQSYFDTVFYKDVIDRHGIRARNLLDLLMRNLLEGFAAKFSISAFEKRLKAHGLAGSKRSVAEYVRHLEEAFFITSCEKFDFSPRKRMMNPRKIYLMDTGFSLLGGAFTENRGRLLENVVALEFFRSRRRTLYFSGKGECDFIVQEETRPSEAWQVCWDLTPSNEERETQGLLEAMSHLKVRAGGILTHSMEGTRRIDGKTIRLIPVWKWLLAGATWK